MDEPRDCHTNGSKSEGERRIPRDITYMQSMAQINLSETQKQNYGHGEQRDGRQRWGGGAGWGQDGVRVGAGR